MVEARCINCKNRSFLDECEISHLKVNGQSLWCWNFVPKNEDRLSRWIGATFTQDEKIVIDHMRVSRSPFITFESPLDIIRIYTAFETLLERGFIYKNLIQDTYHLAVV